MTTSGVGVTGVVVHCQGQYGENDGDWVEGDTTAIWWENSLPPNAACQLSFSVQFDNSDLTQVAQFQIYPALTII